MDRTGVWKLSSAFDLAYSHNPAGRWTNQHQMTANGKRDGFELADLPAVGESISLAKPKEIIQEVIDAIKRWPEFAKQAGVDSAVANEIKKHHRLAF